MTSQQGWSLTQGLALIPLFSRSQCDREIEQVQSQLEEYREPPLSLSRLSLKQQKFKTFRETANVSLETHRPALPSLLKVSLLFH